MAVFFFISAQAEPGEPLPGQGLPSVQEMTKETFEVVQKLIDGHPLNPDALGLMGAMHNHYRNTAEALKWWKRALACDPRRADIRSAMGMVAFGKGDYENAAKLWRQARMLNPRLPQVHTRYASALLEMGNAEQAAAALRASLTENSGDPEAYLLLGQAHLELREFEKAIESYEKVLQYSPNNQGAYYGLSLACTKLGRGDEARKYRAKFEGLSSDEDQAVRERRQGPADRVWAARVLAQAHTGVGTVYRRYSEFDQAEAHWRRGAQLDPENASCRQQLVDLLVLLDRLEEGAAVCEGLIAIDPQSARYHQNSGVLLARLKRYDAARKALQRALELDPDRTTTLNSLVRVLLEQGSSAAEAKRLAESLVKAQPTAASYALLALACHQDGDATGAQKALRQASGLNRFDPEYVRVLDLLEGGK